MTPKKRKHGGGKPKIRILPNLRDRVEEMAGFGLKHENIAIVLGISESTLNRRFKKELSKGAQVANAQVIKSLFNSAMDGNVTAQIFWAKARCGWRETSAIELQGAAPLTIVFSGDEGRPGNGGGEHQAAQASDGCR